VLNKDKEERKKRKEGAKEGRKKGKGEMIKDLEIKELI